MAGSKAAIFFPLVFGGVLVRGLHGRACPVQPVAAHARTHPTPPHPPKVAYYGLFKMRKDIAFVTEGKKERAEEAHRSSEEFRAQVQQRRTGSNAS
jgi:hypothetical protein